MPHRADTSDPTTSPRALLALAAAATGLGLMQTVQMHMPGGLGGGQVPLPQALVRSLAIWWLWALLAPAVVLVARRWHPERVGWGRAARAHALAAVGVSMTHSLVYVPLMLAIVWPELLPRIDAVWRKNLAGNVFGDLFTYGVIAGAYYALDYRRRYRAHAAHAAHAAGVPERWLERLAVRSAGPGGRVSVVPCAEVDWIEADDDYTVLHASGRRYLADDRISALAAKLDPGQFVRVHRSAIVRVDRVKELRPRTHGDYDAILTTGAVVRVSRTYREPLATALRIAL